MRSIFNFMVTFETKTKWTNEIIIFFYFTSFSPCKSNISFIKRIFPRFIITYRNSRSVIATNTGNHRSKSSELSELDWPFCCMMNNMINIIQKGAISHIKIDLFNWSIRLCIGKLINPRVKCMLTNGLLWYAVADAGYIFIHIDK